MMDEIFDLSGHTYGSPRIWLALRNRGVFISEKVVRRLMKEEQIEVRYTKRKRKYSSYIGEIAPAVKDLVRHKFRANQPNELWVTDITEFCAGKDKLYFSPVIDCYDGKVVAWSASRFPDKNLVEVMLNQAVKTLSTDEIEAYKDPDNNQKTPIITTNLSFIRIGVVAIGVPCGSKN